MILDYLIGSPPWLVRLWAIGGGHPSNTKYETFDEALLEANAMHDKEDWCAAIIDGRGREVPQDFWRFRWWFVADAPKAQRDQGMN